MVDFPNSERQSKPVRTEASAPLTEEEKARQEALNTLLQYDRMTELIDKTLGTYAAFRLRPHIIQELNRISIYRIESDAGRWRDVEMRIEQSAHKPPPHHEVPRYIDEMCDYVNDNWDAKSSLHLASYVMWRLNWIHPFIDGNGRTTRAVSYYVLCCKLGFRIPGVKSIPELIALNKKPYYEALEAADQNCSDNSIDISRMEDLLKDLLAGQMLEAIQRANSAARVAPKRLTQESGFVEPQILRSPGGTTQFSTKAGVIFGAVALLFFMVLVLLPVFGHPVPGSSKYLIIIVLALSGGLSATFMGGHATARGSIPLPSGKEHPMRYAVTGGIAVLIVLLVLGRLLFL